MPHEEIKTHELSHRYASSGIDPLSQRYHCAILSHWCAELDQKKYLDSWSTDTLPLDGNPNPHNDGEIENHQQQAVGTTEHDGLRLGGLAV